MDVYRYPVTGHADKKIPALLPEYLTRISLALHTGYLVLHKNHSGLTCSASQSVQAEKLSPFVDDSLMICMLGLTCLAY